MNDLGFYVREVALYMKGHSERLDLDIQKAKKEGDVVQEEFYKGSKSATDMFHRILMDVIEKQDII